MDPFTQPRLVAVFPDEDSARAAVTSLRRAGFDQHLIRVDRPADERASLLAEQHAELDRTVAGPAIGAYTREMTKGAALATVLGGVVGALIAVPFAFIEFADLSFWLRLVIVVSAGILAGTTAGFVIGGSLGSRGPGDPAAAHAGVTVAVATNDQRAVDSLTAHRPIRIDVVNAAGKPLETVDSEDRHNPDGIVQELRTNLDRDDYERHEPGRRPQ